MEIEMESSYYGLIPIAVILALLCGAFLWRWCTSAEPLPTYVEEPLPPYEP